MTGQQGRLSPGHPVAGRYQVARLLGAGEVGEVYDVRDMTTGYAYALKLLRPEITQSPDAWAALCGDAQRAAALESDAIAKAYEFQTEPTLNALCAGRVCNVPIVAYDRVGAGADGTCGTRRHLTIGGSVP